jgi:hypothetical protein
MAQRRTLELSAAERAELNDHMNNDPRPYIRERCAALLKIANGASPHFVALHGLLKRRDPDSVYAWLNRYQQEGFAGLVIRPGRGRKPAFSPSVRKSGRSPS